MKRLYIDDSVTKAIEQDKRVKKYEENAEEFISIDFIGVTLLNC